MEISKEQMELVNKVSEALSKQIPMKVNREKELFYNQWAYCPICNNKMMNWASKSLCDKYCSNCGQALDWSEDDD